MAIVDAPPMLGNLACDVTVDEALTLDFKLAEIDPEKLKIAAKKLEATIVEMYDALTETAAGVQKATDSIQALVPVETGKWTSFADFIITPCPPPQLPAPNEFDDYSDEDLCRVVLDDVNMILTEYDAAPVEALPKGVRADALECPISRALRGVQKASVGSRIVFGSGGSRPTTPAMQAFVRRFDGGGLTALVDREAPPPAKVPDHSDPYAADSPFITYTWTINTG